MEETPEVSIFDTFKPICNRAHGRVDPLAMQAGTAPPMPLLFCINPSSSGHLHVTVSDFHSNTWQASLDYQYLENLRKELDIRESFSTYMQVLNEVFSSNQVFFELSSSLDPIIGAEVPSARLKGVINIFGDPKEVSLELHYSTGRFANDNMGTLIWGIFDSLCTAKSQLMELGDVLKEGKEKTVKVFGAVECIKERQKAMAITTGHKQSKSTYCNQPEKFPRSPADGISPSASTPFCTATMKLEEAGALGIEDAALRVPSSVDQNIGFVDGEKTSEPAGASVIMRKESEGNRSLQSDLWARRHYAEWRRDQGLPEVDIEELPLADFAESLVNFFFMVKKRDGNLFPSESLKAMFRAFARILRAHYKKLQSEGKYEGAVVDASRDMIFEKSRLACLEAMKHSKLYACTHKKKRKLDDDRVPASEEDILHHPANQITDAYGLLRRLCFYVIHKFRIYGHMELYYTTDVEFRRTLDDNGNVCWEYDEKRAMNHKRKSSFREVVRCSENDVIVCLDKYFFHLPPKVQEDLPRLLFLAPVNKPLSDTWFRNQPMNLKTLREWYRYMGPLPSSSVDTPTSRLNPLRNFTQIPIADTESDGFPLVNNSNLDVIGASEIAPINMMTSSYGAAFTDPQLESESDDACDGFESDGNDELTNELCGRNGLAIRVDSPVPEGGMVSLPNIS